MHLATHLGPWKLGTVKDTVPALNQTANMGAAVVSQSASVSYLNHYTNRVFVGVIPAGSQIVNMSLYITTAFDAGANSPLFIVYTGATNNTKISNNACYNNGTTDLGVVDKYTFCDQGNTSNWYGTFNIPYYGVQSTAEAQQIARLWNNIGTSDLPLYVCGFGTLDGSSYDGNLTAGAGRFTVSYVVRNPNGTV